MLFIPAMHEVEEGGSRVRGQPVLKIFKRTVGYSSVVEYLTSTSETLMSTPHIEGTTVMPSCPDSSFHMFRHFSAFYSHVCPGSTLGIFHDPDHGLGVLTEINNVYIN